MDATPKSRLAGTGAYVPEQVLTNFDLEKRVDTSDEWIRERTGIRERRIAAADEASSDMALEAARRALSAAGMTADDLDMIIVGTISPDMHLPACAAFLQQKLGAKQIPAFDVAAACAGFVYAMSIGDQFIRSGACKNVLNRGGGAALSGAELERPHHLRVVRGRRRCGHHDDQHRR